MTPTLKVTPQTAGAAKSATSSKPISRRSKTKPKLSSQTPQGRVLDEKFWLRFGSDPKPTTRQKMLYITIDDVSRVGPLSFNALTMCDELEVSHPLLNFHFGSRDELMAEALVLVYARLVDETWKRVSVAKQTPEARLRAWLEAVTDVFTEIGGWGPLINYPITSREVTEIVRQNYGQHMVDLAEVNLARLFVLIKDLKKKKVSHTELEQGNLPKLLFIADPGLTALTVSVALSISGMAVWRGGRDAAEETRVGAAMDRSVMKLHVDRIIASI
jgi:AcrR family transcriptional regulator